MKVRVHDAKRQLPKRLELVANGEDVAVDRQGQPVARLVPVRKRRASALGAMRGEFTVTDGWERALSDAEAETFWDGR